MVLHLNPGLSVLYGPLIFKCWWDRCTIPPCIHLRVLTIKSKLFRTEQQTPSDLRNGYVPEGSAPVEYCASRKCVYIRSTIQVGLHIDKGIQFKSKLRHTVTWSAAARPPPVSVVAQQYSTATYVSLHFHSRQKKFVARRKMLFLQLFMF